MRGCVPRRAETVSTLKFAHRAKAVRNAAHVNEDADQRTLLRKYEQELRKLRAELQQRQREVVDKRHLLVVGHPCPAPCLWDTECGRKWIASVQCSDCTLLLCPVRPTAAIRHTTWPASAVASG